MTVALDTDVLVHYLMAGAPHHAAVREFVRRLEREGDPIALVPQVLLELLHVCTDPRRFEIPLVMEEAATRIHALWSAREVVQILPGAAMIYRTLELLRTFSLGRKRILDTALAATLEGAGIRRLATLNPGDYVVFPFLDLVDLGI